MNFALLLGPNRSDTLPLPLPFVGVFMGLKFSSLLELPLKKITLLVFDCQPKWDIHVRGVLFLYVFGVS